jgi:hypothetical protein
VRFSRIRTRSRYDPRKPYSLLGFTASCDRRTALLRVQFPMPDWRMIVLENPGLATVPDAASAIWPAATASVRLNSIATFPR